MRVYQRIFLGFPSNQTEFNKSWSEKIRENNSVYRFAEFMNKEEDLHKGKKYFGENGSKREL